MVSGNDGFYSLSAALPSNESKKMKNTETSTESQIVLHRTGYFLGVRSGWFGYKPSPGFEETVFLDKTDKRFCRWEKCRDRVQSISANVIKENGLWFSHRKKTGPKIRKFFEKLETILKINERSEFGNTENPEHCLWMKVSPWWMESVIRRSFLTMALRASQNYKPQKQNILECFEKNKYGGTSMVAINLFLQGYTNYRGKPLNMLEGWSRMFRNKNEIEFKKIMFKRKRKENTEQYYNPIW